MITVTRTCLSCNDHLRGRTDKKFCNDYCRNAYNNYLNSDGNKNVRNINHAMRKNRRILESMLHPGRHLAKVCKQKLYAKGFSFAYFTHTTTNKKGSCYHFCYEYGYLILEGDGVMVVRQNIKNE